MLTSSLRYSRFAADSDDDSDFGEEPQSPDQGYPPHYKKLTPVKTLAPSKKKSSSHSLLYHRANAASSPKILPSRPNPNHLPHIFGLGSTRGVPSGQSLGSPNSSGSLRGSSAKGSSPLGRRLSWDSASGLMRPRLRRVHSHPLREGVTRSNHPLLRPLMQLVPEAFLSFLLWSLLVQFFGDVYWYQLRAGGVSPTLLYLLYLLTPAVALGFPLVRNTLAAYPWTRALLVVGGLLGMAGQLGNSSLYRLTLAGTGVGVMGTFIWDGIWAGTAARRRRSGFGMAGGALLLQALSYAYGGRNPAAASLWTFLLVAAFPGLLVVGAVLYEDAVGWAAREGSAGRLDEEHGETGIEVLSDTALDDILSNDDWDESEVDYAVLQQARLRTIGLLSGGATDSPLLDPGGEARLTAVQSPSASAETLEGSGTRRALKQLDTKHHTKVNGHTKLHVVFANGKEHVVEGNPGDHVAKERDALEEGTVHEDGQQKVPQGRPAAEAGGAHKIVKSAAQEIELCSIEELALEERAKKEVSLAHAKQGLHRNGHAAEVGIRKSLAGAFLAANGYSDDLEKGSPVEQLEAGEREADAMLLHDDEAESTDTWHFLPKKVVDLGRRFGEGEEVPWQTREETPFSEQEAEFEVFRERGRRWTKSGILRTAQMGLSQGCLLFLTHWLLSAPTLASRWGGVDPWWGVLTMSCLALGIALAAEFAKVSKHLHGFGAWGLAAGGCILLLVGGGGSIAGGAMLALAAPSLWVVLCRNTVNVYPGVGVTIAALVHISLALWSSMLVAFGNIPGGSIFRGTAPLLMTVTLGGVALGLGKGPPLSADDRRLLGAMLGAWKAGRPNWGTGVPGRKAVGALGVFVALLLLAAVVHRLLALPVTFHVSPGDNLRALSFNVYQGYNRAGGNNFRAIANVIKEQKPHFVMLQETDTMRIIQGNRDMVDYLSLGLRLYSLATPPTHKNTWGCAILSRLPFQSQSWEVLPSKKGEAACFQHATVEIGGRMLHLMNAHLGEDSADRTAQAEAVARHIRDVIPAPDSGELVVLAGDLNSMLLSPQYMEIVSAGVEDARVEVLGEWPDPGGRDRGAALVFVTSALNCTKWEEPQYDQRKTADGFPVVVTFKLKT